MAFRYERAREILRDEGRNQIWLATQCRSKRTYMSHVLGGRANPGPGMVKLISLALNVSEEYLLGESDERWPEHYRAAK